MSDPVFPRLKPLRPIYQAIPMQVGDILMVSVDAIRRSLSRMPAAGSGAVAGGSGSAPGMSVRTMAESPREVNGLMSGTHQPVG